MTFLVNPFILGGAPAGQWVYDSGGGTPITFTVPEGVTSICILCVGAGYDGDNSAGGARGGGGGALSYSNNVPVTPGEELTVDRYVDIGSYRYCLVSRGSTTLVRAMHAIGRNGGQASQGIGDVRYSGGNGGGHRGSGTAPGSGGGGAAGYSGNGGNGGDANPAQSGAGGSGGGGSAGAGNNYGGSGGGGVGLLGIGPDGTAGSSGHGGGGGSGGAKGTDGLSNGNGGGGGNYGAGGGGAGVLDGSFGGIGAAAVRIIWGEGRSYPNNAGDV